MEFYGCQDQFGISRETLHVNVDERRAGWAARPPSSSRSPIPVLRCEHIHKTRVKPLHEEAGKIVARAVCRGRSPHVGCAGESSPFGRVQRSASCRARWKEPDGGSDSDCPAGIDAETSPHGPDWGRLGGTAAKRPGGDVHRSFRTDSSSAALPALHDRSGISTRTMAERARSWL